MSLLSILRHSVVSHLYLGFLRREQCLQQDFNSLVFILCSNISLHFINNLFNIIFGNPEHFIHFPIAKVIVGIVHISVSVSLGVPKSILAPCRAKGLGVLPFRELGVTNRTFYCFSHLSFLVEFIQTLLFLCHNTFHLKEVNCLHFYYMQKPCQTHI